MTRCTYPGCGGKLMNEPVYEQVGTVSGNEVICLLCTRPAGATAIPHVTATRCALPGCLEPASIRSREGECAKHLIVRRRKRVAT